MRVKLEFTLITFEHITHCALSFEKQQNIPFPTKNATYNETWPVHHCTLVWTVLKGLFLSKS